MFFLVIGYFILNSLSVLQATSNAKTLFPQSDKNYLRVESEKVGSVDSALINESSGLVPSAKIKDHFWTHNDNGKPARIFLLGKTGKLRAKVTLEIDNGFDWESLAKVTQNDKHFLVIGDIGDNRRARKDCKLFIFEEPNIKQALQSDKEPAEANVTKIRELSFTYEDGSRDCESMAYDPLSKTLFLATKEFTAGSNTKQKRRPGVYELNLDLSDQSNSRTATRIADFADPMTTGMDFSPDNNFAVIRTYFYARIFRRQKEQSWKEVFAKSVESSPSNSVLISLPFQRQGESVCFTADGESLMITSEQKLQPVWKVELESAIKHFSRKSRK